MAEQAHILVVDDEPDIRELLQDYLTHMGHRVTAAEDAAHARSHLDTGQFDLALLDIAMPGEDGLSLARHIRSVSDMGIVMLTSAQDVVDRVVGLEVGADDYMTKPFELKEVAARVESVLRRVNQAGVGASDAGPVPMGLIKVDLELGEILNADGEKHQVSRSEFQLIAAFATHPNEVLSREQLLDLVGSSDDQAFDRSIDVRIARLRRKIEPNPTKPQVLKTIRGAGYKFVPM